MRVEIVIIAITAFFIFNTYHDGKYSKLIMSYKKYYQMAFIGFLGICFYLLLKRNPANCKSMLANANNVIKYMPIDRSSLDMLSPIIDFTGGSGDGEGEPGSFITNIMGMGSNNARAQASSEQRILQSGGGGAASAIFTGTQLLAVAAGGGHALTSRRGRGRYIRGAEAGFLTRPGRLIR